MIEHASATMKELTEYTMKHVGFTHKEHPGAVFKISSFTHTNPPVITFESDTGMRIFLNYSDFNRLMERAND